MTHRLERAIVSLNRAHVRACLYRHRRIADLIDEARRLLEAEIVEQRLAGATLEFDDFGRPGAVSPEAVAATEGQEPF